VVAEALESMGLVEGQHEHFANLALFIANRLVHTSPDQAQYDLCFSFTQVPLFEVDGRNVSGNKARYLV